MKRLTTAICCICLMVAGICLAIHDTDTHLNELHASQPAPIIWNIPNKDVLPLDLRLDSDKRQPDVQIRDSVNIIDSVRWINKYRYLTKTATDRTTAREVGEHPEAINPDSLPVCPTTICTLDDREEQPSEVVDTSKVSSIQLTVNGKIVYSKDDNHSTGESQ